MARLDTEIMGCERIALDGPFVAPSKESQMSPIRRVRGKKRRRGKKRKSRFKRRLIQLCLLAALVGSIWLLWPYWRFSEQFADHTAIQPSRLYGRSKVLAVGAPGDLKVLRAERNERRSDSRARFSSVR